MIKDSKVIEFRHDGKDLFARKDMYFINGRNNLNKLLFKYKEVSVSVILDDDDIEEHIAENECILIDSLGPEEYIKTRSK
ncbi:hypothetical protein ACDZ29_25460 [Peribacillus sp. RS7]|uniref:hypothetical protein n=1 Tax=Peribacillus sp. RS7 TaxID=3242679 RepID=UPI0035C10387